MAEQDPDEPLTPVDVLAISDISEQLRVLADQLAGVAKHTEAAKFRSLEKFADLRGDIDDEDNLREAYANAVRQTLIGLGQFRRSYDYWERLIAEFALKRGFSQRYAAAQLGVAVSTINRWAQHPLTNEPER